MRTGGGCHRESIGGNIAGASWYLEEGGRVRAGIALGLTQIWWIERRGKFEGTPVPHTREKSGARAAS